MFWSSSDCTRTIQIKYAPKYDQNKKLNHKREPYLKLNIILIYTSSQGGIYRVHCSKYHITILCAKDAFFEQIWVTKAMWCYNRNTNL